MKTITPFSNADVRSFDELFERLMGNAQDNALHNAPSNRLVPVDVVEADGNLVVQASLPGVEPEAISIQVEKDVLTIRAERKTDDAPENAKVYRRENATGTFVRSLRLSDRLDTERIAAESRNGVLTLMIPRLPEEKPKTITVSVAGPKARTSQIQGETVPADETGERN